MTRLERTILAAAFAVPAVLVTAAGAAHSRTVRVEVLQQSKDTKQVSRYDLAVGDACGHVEVRGADGPTKVDVCDRKSQLEIVLEREGVKVAGSVAAGPRAVVGRVERPDGTVIEVAATVR